MDLKKGEIKRTSRDITYNLHKVVFLLDKMGDKILSEHLDITFSQFKILMALNSECISQKDISNYWDLTEAAVSRQVDILVENGLISRAENTLNRRENILKMTAKGEKLLKKAFVTLDEHYERIFQTLNEKERLVLVEGLHKLLKVICTNKQSNPFINCIETNGNTSHKK